MYAFSASTPLATRAVSVGLSASSSKRQLPSCPTRRRALATIRCASDALPRRRFGQLVAALMAGVSVSPSAEAMAVSAAPVVLGKREEDEVSGYSYAVPVNGWTRSTASLSSFRQATVYLCDDDKDSNFVAVATPVPGDFQKLTSFGGLDNVLNTMVPRYRRGIEGKVIATRVDTDKNAYVIEYTITTNGVQRHLLTVFSLQPGRYVLTLTGQAQEDNWAAREPVIRAVADSFVLNQLD